MFYEYLTYLKVFFYDKVLKRNVSEIIWGLRVLPCHYKILYKVIQFKEVKDSLRDSGFTEYMPQIFVYWTHLPYNRSLIILSHSNHHNNIYFTPSPFYTCLPTWCYDIRTNLAFLTSNSQISTALTPQRLVYSTNPPTFHNQQFLY